MAVVAVVTDDLRRGEAWFAKTKPQFSLVIDHERDVAREFGVYKLLGFDSFNMARPSVFIVDRSLRVRFVRVFGKDAAPPELEDYRRMIAEMTAGGAV